jgi:hypothetical protein
MKKFKRFANRFPVLSVFIGTVLLVMIIDSFFNGGFNTGAGLTGAAQYNDMLGSFVFAEIIGLVIAGLYAVIFRLKDMQQKILPWAFCMMVAIGVAFFFIGANDNDCWFPDPNKGLECGMFSISESLHNTYYYHGFDRYDYSLETAFPKFARLQSVFVVAALVGNALIYIQPQISKKLDKRSR